MEMNQAVWCKTRTGITNASDSTLSHNFLIVDMMASPVNGRLSIALGDKLLQVGIKSFVGFTKQVNGCRRQFFCCCEAVTLDSGREPLEPTTN